MLKLIMKTPELLHWRRIFSATLCRKYFFKGPMIRLSLCFRHGDAPILLII